MTDAAVGPAPAPALVVGYGSTLRRDDAVGRLAAEAVASWALPGVEVRSLTQLTPELAEPLASARLAVFLDARPGIEAVAVEPLRPADPVASVGHSGDPRRLLGLAARAFGSCPPAWLVAIPAADLDFGEGLSGTAARGLAEALGRVAALIGGGGEEPGVGRRGG